MGIYGLISALQAATKTLQQQQQNDDNNPTLEHSIQLGVPTRDPALDKEQIENNGLDDIKILPQWRQFVGALRSYDPEDRANVLVITQYASSCYEIKERSYIGI